MNQSECYTVPSSIRYDHHNPSRSKFNDSSAEEDEYVEKTTNPQSHLVNQLYCRHHRKRLIVGQSKLPCPEGSLPNEGHHYYLMQKRGKKTKSSYASLVYWYIHNYIVMYYKWLLTYHIYMTYHTDLLY